jgi:predicted XRE-type DNA-binding protein
VTKKVLESQEVKEAIAKALAQGRSQTAIAQALGVSQPTISRLVRQEDMMAFVELEALKVLEPLVREFSSIPPKNASRMDLAFRASLKILEMAARW